MTRDGSIRRDTEANSYFPPCPKNDPDFEYISPPILHLGASVIIFSALIFRPSVAWLKCVLTSGEPQLIGPSIGRFNTA